MKKFYVIMCSVMLLASAACTDSDSDSDVKTLLAANELPVGIKTYIETYFPEQTITQAYEEREDNRTSYEVTLDNYVELTFNEIGEIKEIENETAMPLPESVIPATIFSYVHGTYPNAFIVEWKLNSRGQKVKLNTKLKLEFDLQGNFVRIDD